MDWIASLRPEEEWDQPSDPRPDDGAGRSPDYEAGAVESPSAGGGQLTAAHEIMTVEEVARYLRVSERTVYDWAQKGQIPCGKLGNVWRFKRSAVRAWVDRSLGGGPQALIGVAVESRPLELADVLEPGRIVIRGSADKPRCLLELIELLASSPLVGDKVELTRGIFRREELMSTGVGLGCAVPHVRIASVARPVMAAGIYRDGVPDYASMDGQPVRAVFMVAAGTGQHAQHVRLLAAVSGLMQDGELVDRLLSVERPDQAYEILVGAKE